MEDKVIIDLQIIDDDLESGTQKISLVDSPAIEKDWVYFKKWRSKPKSSNVNRILFNDENNELTIKFNDGDIYTYKDVEFSVFMDVKDGLAACLTDGESKWGSWYVGKSPSVGAAVYQILVDGGYSYSKGGSLFSSEEETKKPVINYSFAIEDKKELVGAVAIPDIEIYKEDSEGNPFYVRFSKDVIGRMAEKFMREQRLSETDVQHKNNIDAGTYFYESWIVENDQDKANSIYNLDVPVGTWCVKARVTDPSVWAKVKSGELRGFSLAGDFISQQEYDAYVEDKKIWEKLINLVNSWE